MMDLPKQEGAAYEEQSRENRREANRNDRSGGATAVADDRRDRAEQTGTVGVGSSSRTGGAGRSLRARRRRAGRSQEQASPPTFPLSVGFELERAAVRRAGAPRSPSAPACHRGRGSAAAEPGAIPRRRSGAGQGAHPDFAGGLYARLP